MLDQVELNIFEHGIAHMESFISGSPAVLAGTGHPNLLVCLVHRHSRLGLMQQRSQTADTHEALRRSY